MADSITCPGWGVGYVVFHGAGADREQFFHIGIISVRDHGMGWKDAGGSRTGSVGTGDDPSVEKSQKILSVSDFICAVHRYGHYSDRPSFSIYKKP